MKKPGFLAVLVLLCICSQAQIRMAIAGGAHGSTIKGLAVPTGAGAPSVTNTARFGIHVGFTADIPFSHESDFAFQPGVLLYNKGLKTTYYYDTAVSNRYTDQRELYINYMDIPLSLVYKKPIGPKTKFIVGAGPYFSFFYNGSDKIETFFKDGSFASDENNDLPVGKKQDQYKTTDLGVQALAGFQFSKVFLTVNFSRGLGTFFTESATGATWKHQTVGATLGIYLGQPVAIPPRDKDKDGIPDSEDLCPDQPGPAATGGCPDRDGDGVADISDKCPDTPGFVRYKGCPIPDKDGDGINDEEDKCPDVPGLARYQGCPVPDSDGDGINDETDKCPQVAGLERYQGCPVPDTDGDGIDDELDKCPQVPGIPENNGCPAIKKEIVQQVDSAAKKIQFQLNKAILLPESYETLDRIVAVLRNNPELKVLIEGHSSREGNPDHNLVLSQQRAEAVAAYFAAKGIDSSRLQAKGFGSAQPLNEGRTEAERILNRRVEIRLSNQ